MIDDSKFIQVRIISIKIFLLLSSFSSAQYTKLLDFDGNNGSAPSGDLIFDGTFLYGMTNSGGANSSGLIFKISPDGTGYNNILDFAVTNGSSPTGSLIFDGTFLYGMTNAGGSNFKGTIFKIKPDGTGYSNLFNFNPSDGSFPYGSLISDGINLYGMTWLGGASNKGVMFKIKNDGTGYSKLIEFDNNITGSYPQGSFIFDGTFLYGMTYQGGSNFYGVIFKIKPDGSAYSKLLNFNSSNGCEPKGSLVLDGSFLYGMTENCGTNSSGVIFKIQPDGTNYSTLHQFDYLYGRFPDGSLVSDASFLYGFTSQGGVNNYGVLFKIKTDGTGYSKLLDFDGATNGSYPKGALISDGAFLYGMTESGGTYNMGTVFKYGIATRVNECNFQIDILIYPNPAVKEFVISSPHFQFNIIQIFNTLGEKVDEVKILNSIEFSVRSKLSSGIYFVKISDGEKCFTQKVFLND
jgi:uncharacterized repeat protein (TIGR03803 family)